MISSRLEVQKLLLPSTRVTDRRSVVRMCTSIEPCSTQRSETSFSSQNPSNELVLPRFIVVHSTDWILKQFKITFRIQAVSPLCAKSDKSRMSFLSCDDILKGFDNFGIKSHSLFLSPRKFSNRLNQYFHFLSRQIIIQSN